MGNTCIHRLKASRSSYTVVYPENPVMFHFESSSLKAAVVIVMVVFSFTIRPAVNLEVHTQGGLRYQLLKEER